MLIKTGKLFYYFKTLYYIILKIYIKLFHDCLQQNRI